MLPHFSHCTIIVSSLCSRHIPIFHKTPPADRLQSSQYFQCNIQLILLGFLAYRYRQHSIHTAYALIAPCGFLAHRYRQPIHAIYNSTKRATLERCCRHANYSYLWLQSKIAWRCARLSLPLTALKGRMRLGHAKLSKLLLHGSRLSLSLAFASKHSKKTKDFHYALSDWNPKL